MRVGAHERERRYPGKQPLVGPDATSRRASPCSHRGRGAPGCRLFSLLPPATHHWSRGQLPSDRQGGSHAIAAAEGSGDCGGVSRHGLDVRVESAQVQQVRLSQGGTAHGGVVKRDEASRGLAVASPGLRGARGEWGETGSGVAGGTECIDWVRSGGVCKARRPF